MDIAPRRRARDSKHETYNRDGRWVRSLTARTEPWPIIEHWAAEEGYHLIAARNQRRVYEKEGWCGLTRTLMDVKVNERNVSLTVGIAVDLKMRLISLFVYPRELPVAPTGYVGVKRRREVCRELNSLLFRFGKHPIGGSDGFHPADFDLTSLSLGILFSVPFLIFLIATALRLEVGSGLSRELLASMGERLGVLAGLSTLLLGVHHLGVVRRFPELAFRAGSAMVSLLVFLVVALWMTTQTRTEMSGLKFSHHCFQRYSDFECRKAIDSLSPSEREAVRTRLILIEKSLSLK